MKRALAIFAAVAVVVVLVVGLGQIGVMDVKKPVTAVQTTGDARR
jgi:hypothetical protein